MLICLLACFGEVPLERAASKLVMVRQVSASSRDERAARKTTRQTAPLEGDGLVSQ